MSQVLIRAATEHDLPAMFRIISAEDGEDVDAIPPGTSSAAHAHLLHCGDVVVAEVDGAVVGYSATVTRSGTRFLAQFFVLKGHQSKGLGRRLMEMSYPDDGLVPVCVSAHDPRALRLYIGYGMKPTWPLLGIGGKTAGLHFEDDLSVTLSPATLGGDLHVWDTRLSGRDRKQDLRHIFDDQAASGFWIEHAGQRVGYGVLQEKFRGRDAAFASGLVKIGPVGVVDPVHAADAMLALVQRAANLGEQVNFDIAGPNPALGPLLDSGLQIQETLIFMAGDPARFGDPCCYVPMSGSLY